MIKKNSFLFFVFLMMLACNNKSDLQKESNCKSTSFKDLETVNGMKNNFSVQFPKKWKTNLYYDDLQSSVYTADTTKQLSETLLFDVTHIKKNINFNDAFLLKQEQENLAKKLIVTKSKQLKILNKDAFYTISKGKKGTLNYLLFNIFIKIDANNFLLVKSEIYGDSLVENRICKAISLIDKIELKNAN